jgi:hypothetical protein
MILRANISVDKLYGKDSFTHDIPAPGDMIFAPNGTLIDTCGLFNMFRILNKLYFI